MNDWPLVVADDDGIRPAGKPDRCFYCRQVVGEPHAADCVVVQKKVRLEYTFKVDVMVPYLWTKEDIEFHRNEGTWCANNSLEELAQYKDGPEGCLCRRMSARYVEVLDDTPIRERKGETPK